MVVKGIFRCCFIVTKLTSIFNSIMDRLQMLLSLGFLTCFIVTKVTVMLISIMDRLYMLLKNAFRRCFILAKLTTMLNSIMNRGGPRPYLESPNHQQKMALITISPPKNGQNHHHQAVPKITNHQEKNLQITKYFDRQNDRFQPLLLLFLPCTNH